MTALYASQLHLSSLENANNEKDPKFVQRNDKLKHLPSARCIRNFISKVKSIQKIIYKLATKVSHCNSFLAANMWAPLAENRSDLLLACKYVATLPFRKLDIGTILFHSNALTLLHLIFMC